MAKKYYRVSTLESIARKILMRYASCYLNEKPQAVPLEKIVEDVFELDIEYARLTQNGGELGRMIFDNGYTTIYNPDIKTECWTYFRTAIISAYPNLTNWFVNHLNNIYINTAFQVNYGDYGANYGVLHSYEEVLNTYNENINNLTRDNIVEYIINKISM